MANASMQELRGARRLLERAVGAGGGGGRLEAAGGARAGVEVVGVGSEASFAPLEPGEVARVAAKAGARWGDPQGNLDVDAQRALVRMSRVLERAGEARAMLEAVRQGLLRGIFSSDQAVSHRYARRLALTAAELVPAGRDAAVAFTSARDGEGRLQPAILVFREGARRSPDLGDALRMAHRAWLEYRSSWDGVSSCPVGGVSTVVGWARGARATRLSPWVQPPLCEPPRPSYARKNYLIHVSWDDRRHSGTAKKLAAALGAVTVKGGELVSGEAGSHVSGSGLESNLRRIYEVTGTRVSEVHTLGHGISGLNAGGAYRLAPGLIRRIRPYVARELRFFSHGCQLMYVRPGLGLLLAHLPEEATVFGHQLKASPGQVHDWMVVRRSGALAANGQPKPLLIPWGRCRVSDVLFPASYVEWNATRWSLDEVQTICELDDMAPYDANERAWRRPRKVYPLLPVDVRAQWRARYGTRAPACLVEKAAPDCPPGGVPLPVRAPSAAASPLAHA